MWVTYYYPETYPINTLTWWIYFLIFDIWIDHLLSDKKIEKIVEKNDESLD